MRKHNHEFTAGLSATNFDGQVAFPSTDQIMSIQQSSAFAKGGLDEPSKSSVRRRYF